MASSTHMKKAERQDQSRNILTYLNKQKKLTNEGKRWLIGALDPFHDSVNKPVGYPDSENAKTLTLVQNVEYTIPCPTTVTSGTWDCHIFSLNELLSSTYGGTVVNGNGSVNALTTTTLNLGTVNWLTGPTGFTAFGFSSSGPVLGTGVVSNSTSLPTTYTYANSRLVGLGYELTNTTASMYDQGSITCYRMPQTFTSGQLVSTQASADTGRVDIASYSQISRMPPLTQAAVVNYPDSKEWKASEGCYQVVGFQELSNPLTNVSYGSRVFTDNALSNASEALAAFDVTSYTQLSGSVVQPSKSQTNNYKIAHIDTTGCYVSGLNLQSVLTLRVKFLIEFAPGNNDSTLVELAVPSPCYDPVALKLYSIARCYMPVGVPVSENNLGDWFMRICDYLGEHAGYIGAATSVLLPEAALAGKVTQLVAKQIRALMPEHSKSPQQKQERKQLKKEVRKEIAQVRRK
jgi:hypothetical protein